MVSISIQFKISSFSFIFVMIIAITPPHHKLYWQSFQSISLCLHLHAFCPCYFLHSIYFLTQIPHNFTKGFVWGPKFWKFINSVTILFPSTCWNKFEQLGTAQWAGYWSQQNLLSFDSSPPTNKGVSVKQGRGFIVF